VNWVQCDGCAEWFHLICEGLCKNDVSGDEEYICRACNKLSLAGENMELDPKKEPKEEVTSSIIFQPQLVAVIRVIFKLKILIFSFRNGKTQPK